MSCQTLETGLSQNSRPQGALDADGRPQGSLAANSRPQGDGFCRAFDFSIPVVVGLVTFANDQMSTFSGDVMALFP